MEFNDTFSTELKTLIEMVLKELEDTEAAETAETTDTNEAFINYMTESGFTRKEK